MQERHLAVRDEYLKIGDQRIETGYQSGIDLLRLQEPPTAIIASNSRMLLGLMRSVNEFHVRCPEEVSIVGFDDFPWTQHLTPPLTVLGQATHQMGREALQMLLSKIRAAERNEEQQDISVKLKADLKIRASTARPSGLKSAVEPQPAKSLSPQFSVK
jgi:DNA-binding LacI/PurR family transcriptional regulator